MSEYKTTLEEFTLEELKKIFDDAPEGWEEYSLANEYVYESYYKNNRLNTCCKEFDSIWVEEEYSECSPVFTKDEILRQIDVKFLEVWSATENTPLPKIISVDEVSTVSIDVSEFVNNVNISEGKVILNIDKCDIEGVVELFKGVEW